VAAVKLLPARFLLSDPARLPDPMPLLRALPRGTALIFRPARDTHPVTQARALVRAGRRHGVPVLVSGSVRLMLASGAAGLHAPEKNAARLIPSARAAKQEALVTMSAHGQRALAAAARLKPDAVLVSPVFPTASHPGRKTLGPLRFAALVRAARIPVFALGGVTPKTERRLTGSGASGTAAIGAFIVPVTG
jgi:thiamine-phosphate pyrophosphorylase